MTTNHAGVLVRGHMYGMPEYSRILGLRLFPGLAVYKASRPARLGSQLVSHFSSYMCPGDTGLIPINGSSPVRSLLKPSHRRPNEAETNAPMAARLTTKDLLDRCDG